MMKEMMFGKGVCHDLVTNPLDIPHTYPSASMIPIDGAILYDTQNDDVYYSEEVVYYDTNTDSWVTPYNPWFGTREHRYKTYRPAGRNERLTVVGWIEDIDFQEELNNTFKEIINKKKMEVIANG